MMNIILFQLHLIYWWRNQVNPIQSLPIIHVICKIFKYWLSFYLLSQSQWVRSSAWQHAAELPTAYLHHSTNHHRVLTHPRRPNLGQLSIAGVLARCGQSPVLLSTTDSYRQWIRTTAVIINFIGVAGIRHAIVDQPPVFSCSQIGKIGLVMLY